MILFFFWLFWRNWFREVAFDTTFLPLGGKLETSKLATYVEGSATYLTILGIELSTLNFQRSTTTETLLSNITRSLQQGYISQIENHNAWQVYKSCSSL